MYFSFFFFNDTATTEIYTLSLHDALPISSSGLLDRGYPDNPGFRSILPVGFCQFGLMSQDGLRELLEAVEQALQLAILQGGGPIEGRGLRRERHIVGLPIGLIGEFEIWAVALGGGWSSSAQ